MVEELKHTSVIISSLSEKPYIIKGGAVADNFVKKVNQLHDLVHMECLDIYMFIISPSYSYMCLLLNSLSCLQLMPSFGITSHWLDSLFKMPNKDHFSSS